MDGSPSIFRVLPELKFALPVLAWFLMAECAEAMTHTVEFTCPVDPATVASVGVLWDGVPATSGVPVPPDASGVWRLATHVAYGVRVQVVVISSAGFVSPVSNAQIYGGCLWDRDFNGRVGGSDYGAYLLEMGNATATASEYQGFKDAFGLYCP